MNSEPEFDHEPAKGGSEGGVNGNANGHGDRAHDNAVSDSTESDITESNIVDSNIADHDHTEGDIVDVDLETVSPDLTGDDKPVDGISTGQSEIDPAESGNDEEYDGYTEVIKRLEAERDDYLEMARRVQADYENFKRRSETQIRNSSSIGARRIVQQLLDVLDDFDAASALEVEGLIPLRDKLTGTLKREGLTKVSESGVPFDPNIHEAVMAEPADEEDSDGPVVTEIMRPGYMFSGELLRAAMVKVKGS